MFSVVVMKITKTTTTTTTRMAVTVFTLLEFSVVVMKITKTTTNNNNNKDDDKYSNKGFHSPRVFCGSDENNEDNNKQ